MTETNTEQKTVNSNEEQPNKATWDDVTVSNFVKIEPETEKKLLITNHELQVTTKFDNEEKIEFKADVLEEDGEQVQNKMFSTVSKPLLMKLKPIMQNKSREDKTLLDIIRVGKGKDTKYIVKEGGQ